MIARFHELLRSLWHDPVWSKVIASLIVPLIGVMAAGHYMFPALPAPWVISVVAVIAIWLLVAFVLSRPATRIIAADGTVPRPYYRASIRRFAVFAAIVAPVLPFALWGLLVLHQRLPSGTTLIMVADFETRPTDPPYRVTRIIVEQLKEITAPYKDIAVQRLGHTISWQEGPEIALRRAAEHHAGVIIWGDFDITSDRVIVTTNVERVPRAQLRHQRGWGTSIAGLAELNHFTLQQRLSKEITYTTLFILGLTRYQAGDVEGSIGPLTDAYKGSVANGYNPKDILFTRGRAYFELERYEEALVDFDLLVASDPRYDYALNNRGATYVALGAYDEAVCDLTTAIALNPDDPLAYQNRSGAYYAMRKLDLAIRDANAAIARDSQRPSAYIARGNARDLKGDFDGALADYTRALELWPTDAEAHVNRCIAYFRRGEYTKALVDCDEAIRVRPNFPEAYRARAMTYWKMGQNRKAADDFRKILALHARDDISEMARSALDDLGEASPR